MAADYTDGGGWAKIDTTAAFGLSRAVAMFPQSKREKYTRMLLVLYSSTGRDGCVTMGRRTLAERADVSEDSARSFIAMLEKNGILVPAGKKATPNGNYSLRRWEWLVDDGGGFKPPVGGGFRPGETPGGGGFRLGKTPHNRCQKQMLGAGGSAAAAPPPEHHSEIVEPDIPGFGSRV